MNITKEDISFDSRDGRTVLHASAWRPEGEIKAIVQIVHGMNEYIDRYDRFARHLASQGYYVTGEDHLGHGKSVPEGGVYGYFAAHDAATVLIRDVHRLRKITQAKLGEDIPYYILGHSMGSIMLRNYILRYSQGLAGIMLLGVCTPTATFLAGAHVLTGGLSALKGDTYVSRNLAVVTFKDYLNHIPQPRTLYDWVTSDPEELEKYVKDPMCTGFTFTVNGFYTLAEMSRRMKIKKLMERIPKKLPVLIMSGTEDPVGLWGKDPRELYDTYINMDMTRVTLKLYSGMRHEILNERGREKVYEDIDNWLRQQLL